MENIESHIMLTSSTGPVELRSDYYTPFKKRPEGEFVIAMEPLGVEGLSLLMDDHFLQPNYGHIRFFDEGLYEAAGCNEGSYGYLLLPTKDCRKVLLVLAVSKLHQKEENFNKKLGREIVHNRLGASIFFLNTHTLSTQWWRAEVILDIPEDLFQVNSVTGSLSVKPGHMFLERSIRAAAQGIAAELLRAEEERVNGEYPEFLDIEESEDEFEGPLAMAKLLAYPVPNQEFALTTNEAAQVQVIQSPNPANDKL
jgi:hypothetical protein